tara:strand:- start:34531 stop:34740 length:210 start_codon:yes stop_codon:yes gene_type:complete
MPWRVQLLIMIQLDIIEQGLTVCIISHKTSIYYGIKQIGLAPFILKIRFVLMPEFRENKEGITNSNILP